MKIFISYASEDLNEAEKIRLKLVGAGHKVFFDKNSLPPGGDFVARIKRGIEKSDVFVFLISPNAIEKGRYTHNELQMAEERWPHPRNRVLPLMIKETPFSDLPQYLKEVSILEPKGETSVHLLQGLSKLRPHDGLVRRLIVVLTVVFLCILASLFVPYKTFSNPLEIPPREDARVEKFIDSNQLIQEGHGRIFQTPSGGIDNGYFSLIIPALSDDFAGPEVRLQGGISTRPMFHPNIYLQVQLKPIANVNTIDLVGCNLAVVFKVKSKALFFYSTEADASPENIPIDIDYSKVNTFAFRQIDNQVAAFLNNSYIASFEAKMRASTCSPKVFLKANPRLEARAEFQGLSVYEYRSQNLWGNPIPFTSTVPN